MTRKPAVLFIHKNFPAQFGTFASWLTAQGWDVTFATEREIKTCPGYRIARFGAHRDVTKNIHPYLVSTERAVITGQGFARCAAALASSGYAPDVVVAHAGWGVGTFAKDVWPDTKFVAFAEWWYQWPSVDQSPHDAPIVEPLDTRARTRVRNTPMLLDLMAADAIWCPTRFQATQFPEIFRRRMTVIHDGIDTDLNSPGPRNASFLQSLNVPADAEIVTYVARGMEPQRGFPEMMQAVSALMSEHSKLHVLIVGEDRVAYGDRNQVQSWKQKMLAELSFDEARLHFTGRIPRRDLVEIYRASDVHLYLSVPFVLSWSVLEAMSSGCQIVATETQAVEEFMTDGETAVLIAPNSIDDLVKAVSNALRSKQDRRTLGDRARKRVISELDAKNVIFPKKSELLLALVA